MLLLQSKKTKNVPLILFSLVLLYNEFRYCSYQLKASEGQMPKRKIKRTGARGYIFEQNQYLLTLHSVILFLSSSCRLKALNEYKCMHYISCPPPCPSIFSSNLHNLHNHSCPSPHPWDSWLGGDGEGHTRTFIHRRNILSSLGSPVVHTNSISNGNCQIIS